MTVKEYVDKNLAKSIRVNTEDCGALIGLPYPYIIPSVADMFQEMYYWDSYFANTGLLIRGDVEQAKNNVDNLRYLLDRYGFVLNGNNKGFEYNSQPPFLAKMIREVYDVTGDKEWLAKVYRALEKEHVFWNSKRGSEIGLNRYDWMPMQEGEHKWAAAELQKRIGEDVDCGNDEEAARGLISAGESGWDVNPRMSARSYEYAPADLNSLMYAMEDNLSFFASELQKQEEAKAWKALRDRRAGLCRKYLKNPEGLFMDYHIPDKKQTSIFSAASFYPLYCGMANEEEAEAARNALPLLETAYGILTCEKNDTPGNYQWDYPNGWAPMQLMVAGGLLRYGYREDALRIAKKFTDTVERCYEQTGHLWEKYNIVEGNIEAVNEYDMPTMMGWTFGVYRCLKSWM